MRNAVEQLRRAFIANHGRVMAMNADERPGVTPLMGSA